MQKIRLHTMGHCYSLSTPIIPVFSPLLSSIRNCYQLACCFPFTAVFISPSSLICHPFQYAALPSSIFRFQSFVFNLSHCHHLYFTAVFNSPSFFHRRSLILSRRTRKSIHILWWLDLRKMMGRLSVLFWNEIVMKN